MAKPRYSTLVRWLDKMLRAVEIELRQLDHSEVMESPILRQKYEDANRAKKILDRAKSEGREGKVPPAPAVSDITFPPARAWDDSHPWYQELCEAQRRHESMTSEGIWWPYFFGTFVDSTHDYEEVCCVLEAIVARAWGLDGDCPEPIYIPLELRESDRTVIVALTDFEAASVAAVLDVLLKRMSPAAHADAPAVALRAVMDRLVALHGDKSAA